MIAAIAAALRIQKRALMARIIVSPSACAGSLAGNSSVRQLDAAQREAVRRVARLAAQDGEYVVTCTAPAEGVMVGRPHRVPHLGSPADSKPSPGMRKPPTSGGFHEVLRTGFEPVLPP
ncbi:MAG: hypothetical protein JWM90_1509 [Thermoleophilia bacterium]|nr:hypothetical protein [Thermoleophilia bacterium]